jgi:hypothetical protein
MCLLHSVKASNFRINTQSGQHLPVQWMFQLTEYKYVPPIFGSLGIFPEPINDKTSTIRKVGIIVGIVDELHRSIWIKYKGKDPVIRDSYCEIKDEEYDRALAMYNNSIDYPITEDYYNEPIEIDRVEDEYFEEIHHNHHAESMDEMSQNISGEVNHDDTETTIHNTVEEILQSSSNVETENNNISSNMDIEQPVEYSENRYPTRERRPPDRLIFSTIMNNPTPLWEKMEYIEELTQQGKQTNDVGKIASIKLEMLKIWKKYQAITPVLIPPEQGIIPIKGKLIIKAKTNASNEHITWKARYVCRGGMLNNDYALLDKFSPTASFHSLTAYST